MNVAGRRAGPARRAVLRWAWRLFRREWRKQLLLLTLLTVAVAAATAGATMAVNASSSSNADFGDARAMAHLDPTNPDTSQAITAARRRYGPVEVIAHTSVTVPGSAARLDVRAQDPRGVFSRPMLALRQGHYPTRPGEVALTPAAADLLAADIGAPVKLAGVERTVVGLVENPSDLRDDFALIAPDQTAAADSLTLLFNDVRSGPGAPHPTSGPTQIKFAVEARGNNAPVGALVLVATTLAMTLVGLIAAAGFVVVAQRRQRQLGLMAAIGATDRHLRLVMLANGAIVGVVAAMVGITLGVLGWIIAAPVVEVAANHRIDRLDLPWALIAKCGLLAVLMATAAAWWPARNVARLPTMAALSGRPPRPLPIHRSLGVAVTLLTLGVCGIATAHPTGDHVRPLLLIAGMVAVVVGVVFAAPAAIRAVAAPAARLPFGTRLALRDLVRYQARAAAALAAITLGLGISVAAVGIANANVYRADEGNLSNRQLLIRVGDTRTAPDPSLSDTDRKALDTHAATVAAALGNPALFTLDVAMNPATARDPGVREPIALGVAMGADNTGLLGYPYVATPALLHHYHVNPATIDDATDLLTSRTDNVFLADFTARPDRGAVTHVQQLDLSSYSSAPNSLITENAVRRHGWTRARAGWLVEVDRPLTRAQIAAARSAAANFGLTIETRSTQDELATLRTVATTVGALLALAIVAMTISLIRSEADRDLRTLTATGAASSTRRKLTASTAGALAFVGVLLGTTGAYAALLAGYHSELDKLTPLPLAQLLPLAVGLPVVATLAGWLLAGREPRTFSRQASE